MLLTEILSTQHKVFLEQLTFLKELKEGRSAQNISGIKEMVFMIAQVVEQHGLLEEKYLFPKLRPFLGEDMGPVKVMEFEHKEIKKILENLKESEDPRTIQVESSKFIIFLRDHIAKEEHVLFPLAEEYLGREVLEEMVKEAGLLNRKGKIIAV